MLYTIYTVLHREVTMAVKSVAEKAVFSGVVSAVEVEARKAVVPAVD